MPSPIAQWGCWLLVRSAARPIFFSGIDDSHYDRIHSSLTAVNCFNNSFVGKQPVAWKEYCLEDWLKELKESMGRCTGCHDINEEMLKMALTLSLLISTQELFVDSVDQDQTAQNMQSDL